MSDLPHDDALAERIAQQAAAWVLRSDRGLNAAEQDEFSAWLAADPRHGAQLARHRRHWQRLDQLGRWLPEHSEQPNPDLLAPPLRRRLRAVLPWVLPLAAAAVLTLAFFVQPPDATSHVAPAAPHLATASVPAAGTRVLDDGTTVELNRGAEITVQFTAGERRVRLDRGEAHFFVTKDPARPFVVNAGGVDVRAVGTAFNVRLDAAAVEVLVTEGRVTVDRNSHEVTAAPEASPAPVLEARQRAVVSRATAAAPLEVATLTPGEIERVLAWQHRLLDFNAAPLNTIVAEFNRRKVVQLVVVDPELAAVRVSAAVRSDNVAGFVRLLEAGFGARAERRGETEILLRAAR